MVNALAKLFRISISKGHELIPIEKEVEHARSYLKIQNFRYKNQFSYEFQVEEDCLQYYCNKITLQPIIENAIYHGLDRMVDEGRILIRIYSEGEDVVFRVEDNGIHLFHDKTSCIGRRGAYFSPCRRMMDFASCSLISECLGIGSDRLPSV